MGDSWVAATIRINANLNLLKLAKGNCKTEINDYDVKHHSRN